MTDLINKLGIILDYVSDDVCSALSGSILNSANFHMSCAEGFFSVEKSSITVGTWYWHVVVYDNSHMEVIHGKGKGLCSQKFAFMEAIRYMHTTIVNQGHN